MDTATNKFIFTREFTSEEIFFLCSILAPLAEGRQPLLRDEEIASRAKVALAAVTGWPEPQN